MSNAEEWNGEIRALQAEMVQEIDRYEPWMNIPILGPWLYRTVFQPKLSQLKERMDRYERWLREEEAKCKAS